VFKDISPPFLLASGWISALPAVHRLYGAEAYFYARSIRLPPKV
jgi:hypothetical protein